MAGSAPTNSQAVDFEKEQAAEAKQKEAERQARLQQGQAAIDKIFDFSAATPASTAAYDWSKFKPEGDAAAWGADPLSGISSTATMDTGVPTGYTMVQVAPKGTGAGGAAVPYDDAGFGPPAGQPTNNGLGGSYVQSTGGFGPAATFVPDKKGSGGGADGGLVWALQDANGKLYYQGDPLSIDTPAKAEGGFGPSFYNKYNQKILDYYNPQETKQYSEAGRDLTYNLARAGSLNSSVSADKQGELAYQDALAKATIVNNANKQTGDLQTQIQSNKESLINQLYATEDPTLTANLAQSSANASQLKDPTLTPLAAFITPAATAVGSAIQTATSPYGLYPGGQGQQGSVPAPAGGAAGSFKLITG
jgi:hypothetical protein